MCINLKIKALIGLNEEKVGRIYSRIVRRTKEGQLPIIPARLFVERAVHSLRLGEIGI